MTELSEQLKSYFLSKTSSYYKTYRNRAQLSEFDYMVPVLQPDIVVTGTNDTSLYRAMCMTYDSYPNGWSQYIRDVFAHATETTPSYLLINIYGQHDQQAAIENILQRLAITGELEEDEPFTDSKLEGLLILSPTHFVKLYYYKNVFVLFTNTLQRELLYKLNTAIFHIRADVTKDFMAPGISEIMSDFQDVCNDYVEQMCAQTIFTQHFAEVYTKLYDLKISMAEILAAKKAMETMQNLVANLHNPLHKLEEADKQNTKRTTENQIINLENQLAALYTKLKNCNLYLAGLLQGSEALDESIKQFQALLKEDMQSGELTNMKVAVTHKGWTDELTSTDAIEAFGFQMESVFKFWNTDEARMYIDNTSSCLYDHSKLAQELFEKIFIDKTIKMKVFMQFFLQKQYGENDWNPPHKTTDLFPFSNKKGCKHPHIMRFDCWGDNASPIVQALVEQDYTTAYLMCKQVLYSIAMADSAVVDTLLDAMDSCSNVTDAKWYIYKDKEYSGRELKFVLAKEQAEAEKEVKENEDSENDGSN